MKKYKIYTFSDKAGSNPTMKDIKMYARIQSDFVSDMEETDGFWFCSKWVIDPWTDLDGKHIRSTKAEMLYGTENIYTFIRAVKSRLRSGCPMMYAKFPHGKSVLLMREWIDSSRDVYTVYCDGGGTTTEDLEKAEDMFWETVKNSMRSMKQAR